VETIVFYHREATQDTRCRASARERARFEIGLQHEPELCQVGLNKVEAIPFVDVMKWQGTMHVAHNISPLKRSAHRNRASFPHLQGFPSWGW
jgi:hypothetical protein